MNETTNTGYRQQLAVILRHIDDSLNVHESLMGLYMLPSATANTIVDIVKECLQVLCIRPL